VLLLPVPLNFLVKAMIALVASAAFSYFLLAKWREEMAEHLGSVAERRAAEKQRLRAALAGDEVAAAAGDRAAEPTTGAQPATDKTQSATEKTQPTAGKTQSAAGKTQPTAGKTQSAAGKTLPATEKAQPAMGETQPTAGSSTRTESAAAGGDEKTA